MRILPDHHGTIKNIDSLLRHGTDLLNQGLLEQAKACFEQAAILHPTDLSAALNLANVEREAGEHHEARQRYQILQRALPDNRIVWHNALTGLEDDPQATDTERLQHVSPTGTLEPVDDRHNGATA